MANATRLTGGRPCELPAYTQAAAVVLAVRYLSTLRDQGDSHGRETVVKSDNVVAANSGPAVNL